MNKRITWTLGSLGAAAIIVGGGFALAIPAQASNSTPPPSTSQTGVEDGTNDGETADDTTEVEDGTNDGETADDTGIEDGTNDGESADDTVTAEVSERSLTIGRAPCTVSSRIV
jgi:hypothetical protein